VAFTPWSAYYFVFWLEAICIFFGESDMNKLIAIAITLFISTVCAFGQKIFTEEEIKAKMYAHTGKFMTSGFVDERQIKARVEADGLTPVLRLKKPVLSGYTGNFLYSGWVRPGEIFQVPETNKLWNTWSAVFYGKGGSPEDLGKGKYKNTGRSEILAICYVQANKYSPLDSDLLTKKNPLQGQTWGKNNYDSQVVKDCVNFVVQNNVLENYPAFSSYSEIKEGLLGQKVSGVCSFHALVWKKALEIQYPSMESRICQGQLAVGDLRGHAWTEWKNQSGSWNFKLFPWNKQEGTVYVFPITSDIAALIEIPAVGKGLFLAHAPTSNSHGRPGGLGETVAELTFWVSRVPL
jgi:hypothetical protein